MIREDIPCGRPECDATRARGWRYCEWHLEESLDDPWLDIRATPRVKKNMKSRQIRDRINETEPTWSDCTRCGRLVDISSGEEWCPTCGWRLADEYNWEDEIARGAKP